MSSFVSSIGWGIFWPFLGVYLYDLRASYFQIALLDSLSAIMYLASRLWGAASDFYGLRKPFIVVGSLLSSVPVLFCSLVYSPNHIIELFAISSLFSSVAYPSFLAALTSVEGRSGGTLGWYSMLSDLGWAIGCFSMGFLYEFSGVFAVFASSSLLILVSGLVAIWYPRERRAVRDDEDFWSYMKTALTFKFKAPKGFGRFLLSVFIAWFGIQWCSPLLRIRMYDLFERSKVAVGIVWGIASSISSAAVGPLAGRLADKVGGWRLLQVTILLYVLRTPVFAFVNDPILYSILWIAPIWSFFWVGNLAAPAQMTHRGVRGEAMGAHQSALNLGISLGFIGGLFADNFGRELGIILTSIFFMASFIPLYPHQPKVREVNVK